MGIEPALGNTCVNIGLQAHPWRRKRCRLCPYPLPAGSSSVPGSDQPVPSSGQRWCSAKPPPGSSVEIYTKCIGRSGVLYCMAAKSIDLYLPLQHFRVQLCCLCRRRAVFVAHLAVFEPWSLSLLQSSGMLRLCRDIEAGDRKREVGMRNNSLALTLHLCFQACCLTSVCFS